MSTQLWFELQVFRHFCFRTFSSHKGHTVSVGTSFSVLCSGLVSLLSLQLIIHQLFSSGSVTRGSAVIYDLLTSFM